MKYGIYDSNIVIIQDNNTYINEFGEVCFAVGGIYEIPENLAKEAEEVINEFRSIKDRMHKLQTEYEKKRDIQHEIYMQIRAKEMRIVNMIRKRNIGLEV